jgi:hypothetical protein
MGLLILMIVALFAVTALALFGLHELEKGIR